MSKRDDRMYTQDWEKRRPVQPESDPQRLAPYVRRGGKAAGKAKRLKALERRLGRDRNA